MQQAFGRYDSIFPINNREMWRDVLKNIEHITEIRIRVGKPTMIYMNQKEVSIDEMGKFIYVLQKGKKYSYREIQDLIDFWCQDSRYAFQNEIKNGFLTIQGGHRIGLCGEGICDEYGNIKFLKYISGINIRIAHEIKGVAEKIMKYLYINEQIGNTLIVSPPGAGKTTLLRDIIRLLADGTDSRQGINMGVVDERGEIAACLHGIPQLDVGMRTDVLDNCRKATGMRMLLRTMTPTVIAVDELGNEEEIELIRQMVGNGCGVIATIHGNGIEELKRKGILQKIWEERLFENIIFLFKKKNEFHGEVYRNCGEESLCCSW